jgi:ParB/RepB/Spo0J family partition protein
MRDITMPLAIDDIAIGEGRREVVPSAVKRLADSIERVGLRHPITVRKKGEGYALVAGLHRIEAYKKLGREHIPACIVTMTNAEARMWEIAENLHRAELTKLERAEQIEEWRELMEQFVTSNHPAERGVRRTARELGVTPGEVHRSEKIAGLDPEVKDAAIKAGIDDNQSKLLEVAKEPPERQVAKVYELKGVPLSKNWRDQFQTMWGKGTEDDHAWARDYIDKPIMDRRHG